ncbi:MAG TPA: hypothetical protein PLP25_05725 [Candidatus Limiplasma sp.]|nr:hypothetical protein [Candidatus Limiplasma sp.]HPS81339.1 hypothetical protein [Candidatus Limiplasma sp.]
MFLRIWPGYALPLHKSIAFESFLKDKFSGGWDAPQPPGLPLQVCFHFAFSVRSYKLSFPVGLSAPLPHQQQNN